MRKKVLIVTCEMLPFPGKPVCGGGIRVWGLGQGLAAHGHQVIYSLPTELVEDDRTLPDSIRANSHEPESLNERIVEIMPDLVIVEQWGLATYLSDLKIPLALDLHGPLSLENSFKTQSNFLSDAMTKIDTLSKADLLIVPGQFQKHYFLTWYLMAGADPLKSEIAVVPVGMPSDLPKKKQPDDPRLVFGGVTWPWIDPFPGLEAAAKTVADSDKASFDLFVQHPPLMNDHPLYSINRDITKSYDERLAGKRGVHLNDFIPHDKLIDLYASSTAAYDAYLPNHERELAVTTRTVEYLWAGLPVIYAQYGELARYIDQYDAGWIVDPSDEAQVEQAVKEAIEKPEIAAQKGANAQKLVKTKYTWGESVKNLLPFVNNPKLSKKTGTLISGFRDYFRNESIDEILEGKNQVAKLNDEIRAIMIDSEKEKRNRDRRIEELGEDVRKVTFEKDKQLRQMLDDHKKELDKKDDEIKRLLNKVEYETQSREEESRRLHTDRQLSESKLQDEIKRLNLEKEHDRKDSQAELKKVTEEKDRIFADAKSKYEKEAKRLQERIDSVTDALQKAQKELGDEIKDLNKDKEQTRKDHEAEVRKLVDKHEGEVSRLRQERDEAIEEFEEKLEEETERFKRLDIELQSEIRKLNRERQEMVGKYDLNISALHERYENRISALLAEQDQRVSELESKVAFEGERRQLLQIELQNEIRTLNRERQELVAVHDRTLAEVRERYEQKLVMQSDQHQQALKESAAKLEKEVETKQAQQERLQSEIRTLNREQQELISKHDIALSTQRERYEQKISEQTADHKNDLKDLEKQLEKEAEAKRATEERLQSEIRTLNRERQDMVARYDINIATLHERYEQRIATLLAEQDERIKELDAKVAFEIERRQVLSNELQGEIRTLNRERQEMVSSHDKALTEQKDRYEKRMEELREDLQKTLEESAAKHDKVLNLQKEENEKKIQALTEQHEKATRNLEERVETENDRRRALETELQTEIRTLNREQQELVAKHDLALTAQKEKNEQKLNELTEEYKKAAKELEAKLETEMEKRRGIENDLQGEIRTLNRERQEMVSKHDQAITGQKEKNEQKLNELADEYKERIKELERKLELEMDRRRDLEKELQAEIRTLNRERQEMVSKHDKELSELVQRHEKQTQEARQDLQDEIKELRRKYTRESEKAEDAMTELQKEFKRVNILREEDGRRASAQMEKIAQSYEDQLTQARQNANREIQEREKQLRLQEQAMKEIEVAWQGKLDDKDKDIEKLRLQHDELNAQITARLTELDRIASEKEIYIREAEKRFDLLEDKITVQRSKINTLSDEVTTANSSLERSNKNLTQMSADLEIAQQDLNKITRHAENLEGELPALRKRAELAERQYEDMRDRPGIKKTSRRKKRNRKYLGQLPRMGVLWGVNLASNAYMEMWQKRTGKTLFAGTDKPKKKKSENDQ